MTRPLSFDPIAAASENWPNRDVVPAMAAATSIMRAQQLVLASVDAALRPVGLTFARFEALRLLAFTRAGELPLGKIGERLMVHPTSVTNIVDRLESDGLVERRPHPDDRRTTLAGITADGRTLVDQATVLLDDIRYGLAALDLDDLTTLTEIIRRLRRSTGDFEESAVGA
jgi:DNA-binding MarR family transcriptional regulator